MPRHRDLDWAYDPRPVDSLTIRFDYDWASGGYRLRISVKRHGQERPQSHSYSVQTVEEAEGLALIAFSSVSRDLPDPF